MAGPLPLGDPAPADGHLPDDLPFDASVPFSAYLHIPFCTVRCGYCDFNTYTSTELRGAKQEDYASTLISEIGLARRVLADAGALRPMDTVFFGGGTPTLLPAGDLARMLEAATSAFGLAEGAEVTVEANPRHRDARGRAHAGRRRCDADVGRYAVGCAARARLARPHAPARERDHRGRRGQRTRVSPVSVDLIYGAPGGVARRLGSLARRGARAGVRPHLRLRADHRGGHEARSPDPPRRGSDPR